MPRSYILFRRQQRSGNVAVLRDARFQHLEVGKFFFVAYFMQEIDAQMLAVEVAGEIEQVHFQRRATAAVDRRAQPQTRGAVAPVSLRVECANGKDSGQGRPVVPKLQVRRGKADLPAELVAVHHAAADAVGPAEQRLGFGQPASGQRTAELDTRTRSNSTVGIASRPKPCVRDASRSSEKSPARLAPKRKSSPISSQRMPRPSSSTRSMKSCGDLLA